MVKKIFNFKVPLFLRVIGVLAFSFFTCKIADFAVDDYNFGNSTLFGCAIFLIMYLIAEIGIAGEKISGKKHFGFIGKFFVWLSVKFVLLGLLVSIISLIIGCISILNKDGSLLPLSTITIFSFIFLLVRRKKYKAIDSNKLIAWLPVAISPILSVMVGCWLLNNIALAAMVVVAIILLIFAFGLLSSIFTTPEHQEYNGKKRCCKNCKYYYYNHGYVTNQEERFMCSYSVNNTPIGVNNPVALEEVVCDNFESY